MDVSVFWVDLLVVEVGEFEEGEEVEFEEVFVGVVFLFFLHDWVHDELRVFWQFLGVFCAEESLQGSRIAKCEWLVLEELGVGVGVMAEIGSFFAVEYKQFMRGGGECHPDSRCDGQR